MPIERGEFMTFPDDKTLKKMRSKLEKLNGTLMLPEYPTPLEQFRWDICQKFVKYKRENGITHEEMGKLLGVDKGKISKILRHRVDEFSTDRLISYLQILEPDTSLKVG